MARLEPDERHTSSHSSRLREQRAVSDWTAATSEAENIPEREIAPFSELATIARAAAGDTAAFRALVVAYETRIVAYLMHMLGDIESAHDIAQETFLAVYQQLPRWHPPDRPSQSVSGADDQSIMHHPLSPWLYRIATNRALSLLRVRSRRIHIPYDPLLHDSTAPGTPVLEERIAARELLQQALARLSAEDAACVVLHYVEGERYGAIAERLDMTSEAVRKRVSRGLAVLRATYVALEREELP